MIQVYSDITAIYSGVSPTRLIAAWGDSTAISYHGAQFGKAEVVMFEREVKPSRDPLLALKSTPGVSFFDITTVSEVVGTSLHVLDLYEPDVFV